MGLDINFNRIKIVDDSRQNGFEEFSCQVFYLQQENLNIPSDSIYYRKRGAGGDGGVEAYFTLPDGKEIGLQAKYFLSLDDSKWSQVRHSLEKARKTHPNLTRYIICFPVDLTDSRKKKCTSNQDKFNELANDFNDIEIIFWGHSQLISFLENRPELIPFWFDEIKINQNDFIKNFEIFKDNIGNRYQPNIHINIENFDYFDYLEQNNSFTNKLTEWLNDIDDICNLVIRISNHVDINNEDIKKGIVAQFKEVYYSLEFIICNLRKNLLYEINFDKLQLAINYLLEMLYELPETRINKKTAVYELREFINDKRKSLQLIKDFSDFINSKKIIINQQKLLFLNGDGGMGKTHLLASIIDRRLEEGLISLIFDSGQFDTNTSICENIKKYFGGFNCSDSDFFSSLNTLAFLSGQRGVIFIDGLDENLQCKNWQKKINHFIKEIEKYENLAVAISYRTEYENIVLPEKLIQNKNLFCTAPGFTDVPIENLLKIFNKYEINVPTITALYPEFHNPLFLILYCNSISNYNLSDKKSCISGYVDIFMNYLDSINHKISNKLDLDIGENIIQKICLDIADKMHEQGLNYIALKEVKSTLDEYYSTQNYSQSLFKSILSEGVIHKFYKYDDTTEYIKFSFGKLGDFLLISSAITKEFDETNPLKSFGKGSSLYKLAHEYIRPTFIEILAILIAEKTQGKYEILDIFEDEENEFGDNFNPYTEYFIKSIIYRNGNSVSNRTLELLLKYCEDETTLIETLLNIALKPNCKYTAKNMHKYLFSMSLINRDLFWSLNISHIFSYENSNIINNIINFCWRCDDCLKNNKHSIDYAYILSWFLSSSNRELRDKSTKSLVNLLKYNLEIVPNILREFQNVNDLYVKERLYCAVYGACLLNQNDSTKYEIIKEIASIVYELNFKYEEPPVHFYLRDYAKNIIEFGLSLCNNSQIDANKIRPPYKSKFPYIPTLKTIKKIYNIQGEYGTSECHPLLRQVYHSVMSTIGDFGNYVISYKIGMVASDDNLCNKYALRKNENMLSERAKRWILKRVASLCDYKKLPQDFEDNNMYNGRQRNVIERLGKKYQWIALYEFLSYALDKYVNCESVFGSNYKYTDAIQISRDIDPTLTSKEFYEKNTNFKNLYNEFVSLNFTDEQLKEWCQSENVPDPKKLIEQQIENRQLFNLSTVYTFVSKFDKDCASNDFIEFYWFLKSYIVNKADIQKVKKFFNNKTFYGRWMPEETQYSDIYQCEYSIFKYIDSKHFDWLDGNEFRSYKPNFNIKKLAAIYFNDSGMDCSYNNIQDFLIPSPVLIKEMDLKYSGIDGSYLDNNREIITINPYIFNKGINSLLVNRDKFIQFLNKNNYTVFWTIGGEKYIKQGKVDISGLYYWDNGIQGNLRFSEFESFPRYK